MAPATASNSSYQGDWRASKVVGLNVYNDNNESIGTINDLLTDKSGNIKAVVLGVGGLLGVGEHLVAVAFDKLKFVEPAGAFDHRPRATPPTPAIARLRPPPRAAATIVLEQRSNPGIRTTRCSTPPRTS